MKNVILAISTLLSISANAASFQILNQSDINLKSAPYFVSVTTMNVTDLGWINIGKGQTFNYTFPGDINDSRFVLEWNIEAESGQVICPFNRYVVVGAQNLEIKISGYKEFGGLKCTVGIK